MSEVDFHRPDADSRPNCDRKGPPISSLSPELLYSILELIADTSTHTLPSLTLVNKSFYYSARGLLDRHQVFNVVKHQKDPPPLEGGHDSESTKFVKTLLRDSAKSHIIKNIRFVTLQTAIPYTRRSARARNRMLPWPEDEDLEKGFVDIVELIKRLPKLEKLTFTGSNRVPLILINVLQEYHPRAALHVENWSRIREDEDHNNPVEIALAKSLNLRSLSAKFSNEQTACDLRIPAFKRIIALAPNLESVRVFRGNSGCVVRGYSEEQMDETEQRAKLFDVERPSPNSIRSLISHGRDFVKTFEDVTDMSKLERLQINSIPGLDYFVKDGVPNGRFPSLSHLSLTVTGSFHGPPNQYNEVVDQFLLSCNPLESLSIKKWYNTISLPEILLRHGSTLRKLSLHEEENTSLKEPRQVLSQIQLEHIQKVCPLLEDIEVDINRSSDGKVEKALFSSLAGLPKLKTVRLYIDLGIAEIQSMYSLFGEPDDEPLAPHTENPFHTENPGWLERIWSSLQSEKENQGSVPVKNLHVKNGEVERSMGGGYPAGWVIWESENSHYLMARASDRDDRPDEIAVIRDPERGDDVAEKGWETRPVPSAWRFGEKWEAPETVGKFE